MEHSVDQRNGGFALQDAFKSRVDLLAFDRRHPRDRSLDFGGWLGGSVFGLLGDDGVGGAEVFGEGFGAFD